MVSDSVRAAATLMVTFMSAGALRKARHQRRLKRAFGQRRDGRKRRVRVLPVFRWKLARPEKGYVGITALHVLTGSFHSPLRRIFVGPIFSTRRPRRLTGGIDSGGMPHASVSCGRIQTVPASTCILYINVNESQEQQLRPGFIRAGEVCRSTF